VCAQGASRPARIGSERGIAVNSKTRWVAWVVAAAAPGAGYACACGCGVFDVATSAMFPGHSGPVVFLEQGYMDQSENWSGRSQAPTADNDDKRIRTNFWTMGFQYMFNRSWTLETDLPFWQRRFVTTDESGATQTFDHSALGDMRVKLTYTGFEADLSTGVTFGVQLPTGDSTYVGLTRTPRSAAAVPTSSSVRIPWGA
jgi:hypothetical protein